MNIKNFFSEKEKNAIESAISNSESKTSGEIRLHVDSKCHGDLKKRAILIFHILGMQKTKLRNSVLFYIAIKDRKFFVLGDKGINDVVPSNFWDNIYTQIKKDFAKGNYSEGLCKAIETTGEQLSKQFPIKDNDINELPNDISFGK